MNRPSMRHQIVGARLAASDPIVKKTSEAMMTGLRPKLSEKLPLKRAPKAAPIIVIETTMAICESEM